MIKKIIAWLHLWLGLISGSIMFVVCLTACIWVFNEEIVAFGQPWKQIEKESKPYLLPSVLQSKVEKILPGKKVRSITYKAGEASYVWLYKKELYNMTVYVNPYSGAVLEIEDYKEGEFHFFSFILKGHRFLWLPWKIGRPIVNYATVIFILLLISGLILWWPKNKPAAKQRIWFRWKDSTQWKRKNYDLHNIMGFYAMIFLLAIALTGITFGLEWFSKSVYWTVSGGDSRPGWGNSISDTLQKDSGRYTRQEGVDLTWQRILSKHPSSDRYSIGFPDVEKASAAIDIFVYPKVFDGFQYDSYSFDQYTLKEISKKHRGKHDQAGPAEKLERMYYGIHVGSILGLTGKVIAFLGAFIGASLPVTGFCIWWGRRKKTKNNNFSMVETNSLKKTPNGPKIKIKPRTVSAIHKN